LKKEGGRVLRRERERGKKQEGKLPPIDWGVEVLDRL
jgi:hypothetical protein